MINKNIKNMKEIWKHILGFEGAYMISNQGRVKSLKRILPVDKQGKRRSIKEKILSQPTSNTGYKFVSLYKENKIFGFRVHRLIAIAFIPNPNNYPIINHINAVRTDNRIENLEWCTHDQNMIHASLLGLFKGKKGEDSPFSKIKKEDVLFIRDFVENGGTQKEMALKFKIHSSTVSAIVNRKKWKHV